MDKIILSDLEFADLLQREPGLLQLVDDEDKPLIIKDDQRKFLTIH